MKSQLLLTALAATLLSSGAVFADNAITRIDHPNGPATYVSTPDRGATIGVYAGDRSFGRRQETARSESGSSDSSGRTLVPIHHGRGQVDYVAAHR
jgi:hypothetical protein